MYGTLDMISLFRFLEVRQITLMESRLGVKLCGDRLFLICLCYHGPQ